MPLINTREFTPLPDTVQSNAPFSHKVSLGTLQGDARIWFKKEMPNPAVAKIEILAQEFFRLLLPDQPETRLAQNEDTGAFFILSEKVLGYHDLPTNEANKFADGTYRGLGQVMLISMFVREIDLKNGNLGLDDRGRVIKIDGDWSFAGLSEGRFPTPQYQYSLTAEAVESLPYPKDFYTFNWLDLTQNNIHSITSEIVNPALSQAPQFRAEINQAMLKICLIPDSFIDKFVDAYMPAGADRFVTLIKARRDELRLSALQNRSFQDYLNSSQVGVDALNFIEQMKSFQVNGRNLLRLRIGDDLNREVQMGVRFLITPVSQCSVLLDAMQKIPLGDASQCELLLKEIQTYKVSDNDYLLNRYVMEKALLIRDCSNLDELLAIKAELYNVLSFVKSPEVLAVKQSIKKMREEASFFSIGTWGRANLVERALCNTPLIERLHVVTKEGAPNALQEALASYSLFGITNVVYKNEQNEIDISKSAETFRLLKEKFTKVITEPVSSVNSHIEQGTKQPKP